MGLCQISGCGIIYHFCSVSFLRANQPEIAANTTNLPGSGRPFFGIIGHARTDRQGSDIRNAQTWLREAVTGRGPSMSDM